MTIDGSHSTLLLTFTPPNTGILVFLAPHASGKDTSMLGTVNAGAHCRRLLRTAEERSHRGWCPLKDSGVLAGVVPTKGFQG